MKKRNVALVLAATMMLSLAGCAGSNEKTEDTKKAQTETENKTEGKEDAVQIDGALSIYCGAGMQQPFQEIADAFQEETGCEMNVTYANAAQIQTQIRESQEGDFFIAGSKEELKPVEEFVTSSEDLVKHIPVYILLSFVVVLILMILCVKMWLLLSEIRSLHQSVKLRKRHLLISRLEKK